ncbi:MAG: hypothetical protein EBU07_02155 [Betaproteobacteria bacterium]|nr:hypothetical protein [Betaproteobacteria bacterium]NBS46338.1 hypothetical protein [Betaproteobacteria bacterium]
MHSAPAVSYPVQRWLLPVCVVIAMALAGAGALLAWQHAVPAPWSRVALAWAALASCAAVAFTGTLRQAAGGVLHWDGQVWCFEPARAGSADRELSWTPDRISIALDLQSVVLLSVRGAPRWLWLRSATDPEQWNDLRRALRAHTRGAGSDP